MFLEALVVSGIPISCFFTFNHENRVFQKVGPSTVCFLEWEDYEAKSSQEKLSPSWSSSFQKSCNRPATNCKVSRKCIFVVLNHCFWRCLLSDITSRKLLNSYTKNTYPERKSYSSMRKIKTTQLKCEKKVSGAYPKWPISV